MQCRTHLNILWEGHKGTRKEWPPNPEAHKTAVSVSFGEPHPFSFRVSCLDASSFRFNKPSSLKNCFAHSLHFYSKRGKDHCTSQLSGCSSNSNWLCPRAQHRGNKQVKTLIFQSFPGRSPEVHLHTLKAAAGDSGF